MQLHSQATLTQCHSSVALPLGVKQAQARKKQPLCGESPKFGISCKQIAVKLSTCFPSQPTGFVPSTWELLAQLRGNLEEALVILGSEELFIVGAQVVELILPEGKSKRTPSQLL